jgi:hypothetical protein
VPGPLAAMLKCASDCTFCCDHIWSPCGLCSCSTEPRKSVAVQNQPLTLYSCRCLLHCQNNLHDRLEHGCFAIAHCEVLQICSGHQVRCSCSVAAVAHPDGHIGDVVWGLWRHEQSSLYAWSSWYLLEADGDDGVVGSNCLALLLCCPGPCCPSCAAYY